MKPYFSSKSIVSSRSITRGEAEGCYPSKKTMLEKKEERRLQKVLEELWTPPQAGELEVRTQWATPTPPGANALVAILPSALYLKRSSGALSKVHS
jgi:hypothetical protein